MSAARLRAVAADMREKAQAATGATHYWDPVPAGAGVARVFCGQVLIAKTDETLGGSGSNAAHIAAWHPAVALAVANLLDHAAARAESKIQHGGIESAAWSHERDALAVCDAWEARA
jgi:hypothetical protein